MQLLLEFGTGFDYEDKRGTTMLKAAVECDNRPVVDILSKHDADLGDHEGLKALHIASRGVRIAVVDVLLEHGSDIKIESDDRYTAFDIAHTGERMFNFEMNFFGEGVDIFKVHPFSSYEIIVEHLQLHIIELQAANCYLSKKNINSIDIRCVPNFRTNDKCEKEIENIKIKKISNNISVYDILTKGLHQITIYLRNENVMQAFIMGDYKTKFINNT